MADFDNQEALASALQWWLDAGADVLVEDAVRDWAAAPPAPARAPEPAPTPAEAALPDTLEAFLAWRGGPDAPDAGWGGDALLASGPADARVMVLVDQPDREDCAAGQLLTGAQGRLFDRMLAAVGFSRETVHLVALCVRRPATGRVRPADAGRLGEIARHHVDLVAPRRLLLMGDAASGAVLGMNVADARGRLRPIHHNTATVEAVAMRHPRFLLDRPAEKAGAWRDLQLLVGDVGT
jgi:uracil-DNA glycosylase